MNRRDFVVAAAALVAAPDALARRLGGTPLTLVTADTEAHVAVVGMDGRVQRRIPTLEGPRSIESAFAATAVVAHTTEGAVSLLDAVSLEVRRVLRAFAEPRYTAIQDQVEGARDRSARCPRSGAAAARAADPPALSRARRRVHARRPARLGDIR